MTTNYVAYVPKDTVDALKHMRKALSDLPDTDPELVLAHASLFAQAHAMVMMGQLDLMKPNVQATKAGAAPTPVGATPNWSTIIANLLAVVGPLLAGVSPIFAALLPMLAMLLQTLFGITPPTPA